jgi:hypothetical protein
MIYLSSQDHNGMLALFNDRFNDCATELSGASSDSDDSHGFRALAFCFFLR